jgi:hypothetical protein
LSAHPNTCWPKNLVYCVMQYMGAHYVVHHCTAMEVQYSVYCSEYTLYCSVRHTGAVHRCEAWTQSSSNRVML